MSALIERLAARLASPWVVLAFWVGHGVLFATVQITGSSTLTLDFAAAVEGAQNRFALAYELRNPPLYEWLLVAAQGVLGTGPLAQIVLRYGLMAAFGMLVYAAARQVSRNARLAGAISVSLPLLFWFGWDFHYRVTHTLPMIVAGMALWILVVDQVKAPRLPRALAIGLLCGLGLIAKWNFALFLGALTIALLFDPAGRRMLASPATLAVPLAALVPLAPVIAFVARTDADMLAVAGATMIDRPGSHLDRLAEGLVEYAFSVSVFLLPWLVVLAIGFAMLRVEHGPASDRAALRLAATTTLAALAIAATGIVALGVSNFGVRYMYPILLLAPVVAAGFLVSRVDLGPYTRRLVVTALVVLVLAGGVRALTFRVQDVPWPRSDVHLEPYAALAEAFTAQGWETATFVTFDRRDAGNLAAHLPRARAHARMSFRVAPPAADPSSVCVLVWRDATLPPGAPVPRPDPAYLNGLFGAHAADLGTDAWRTFAIAWRKPLIGAVRRTIWYAAELPDPARCR